jgi:hypothetical protein
MDRPLCPCKQRFRAIAYHRNGRTQYRSRCDYCIRKGKNLRPPQPTWAAAGYQKKTQCDRCGFRARYAGQLLVYHTDGDLRNAQPRNLKTVCLNCVVDIQKQDLPWAAGDLEHKR